MKPFSRSDRVGGEIQRKLSDILQKEVKDPRLEMATVTDVSMSSDLKSARIYFAIPDGRKNNAVKKAIKGFESAHGYIKRVLARELGLRYMPRLSFFYDESFDYGAKIDSILNSVKKDEDSFPDYVQGENESSDF